MGGGGFVYAGMLVGAVALIAPALTTIETPMPVAAAPPEGPPPPSAPIANGRIEAVREAGGRYVVAASVNGHPVRMLVDTGASVSALAEGDARRAGLGTGDFTATATGAGGTIALRPVTVQRLAIGPVVRDNVPLMVAGPGLAVSLLGQDMIHALGGLTIRDGTLVIG